MTELTLDQLNAQIDSRIAHMKHSGLGEDEKKHELTRISRMIRLRDSIDMKHQMKSTEYPNRIRSMKVPGPQSKKEVEELMVLIDSV